MLKKSLAATPLSSQRYHVLTEIVDASGLESASFKIAADLQRNFIANAGELPPDKHTSAAKNRVSDKLRTMRAEMMPYKPMIRKEIISTLVWQYSDMETTELFKLRDLMNRYIA